MSRLMDIIEVPIALIDEDVTNHRLVSDLESDRQLRESIKANGVQQPVKVSAKPDGRYTLVFGFRRKAAAAAVGLAEIPAIVEQDLDINTIRALQAIENLERRELHPMEEAQFCQDLAQTIVRRPSDDDDDGLAEALAQRIGRSRKWVELRLAMARLSPRVKQAFMDGDIHLQHAQLIARLVSHDAQEEVLGYVRAQESHWLKGRERQESRRAPSTIADTRAHVEKMLRDLGSVPWKLEARFADLPDCASCPHNSANRMDLFDGDEPKKPQCLDATCYSKKTKAASRALVKATNTALKDAEKVTPTIAIRAIVERDVEFIRTPAVVEAAKRRQAPEKKTGAETRGESKWERQHKIERAHREALEEWSESIVQALSEKMQKPDPIRIAMMALISESRITCDAEGVLNHFCRDDAEIDEAKSLLPRVMELFKGNGNPESDLAELARLLAPWLDQSETEEYPHLAMLNNAHAPWLHPFSLSCLRAAYGIDATEPPTLDDIEAELYPKANKDAA